MIALYSFLLLVSVECFDRLPSKAITDAIEAGGGRRLHGGAESRRLQGSKAGPKGSVGGWGEGYMPGKGSNPGKGEMGKGAMPGKGAKQGKGSMPGKGEAGKGAMPWSSGKGGKGSMPPPNSGKGGKGAMPPPPGKGNMGKGGKGSMPPPPGKGSAGKGTMPGKGGNGKGSAPSISCPQISIYFYIQDLTDKYEPNAIGGGFDNVPFYSTQTGDQIGFYSDQATNLTNSDCVGTGSFSFGLTHDFPSQISFSFTCNGTYNAITGGNGQFGCAEGYEELAYEDSKVISSTLNICGTLCPWYPPHSWN